MRGVNKVILIGNLGADPEVRYSASGSAIATVSLATTDSWQDKQSGERQERTEWHRVVFFNRLAEIVGEYLRKGRPVYVEGRLQTRKWQDQNGHDRWTTEIVAQEMQMLGGRDEGGAAYAGGGAPAQHAPQSQPQHSAPNPAPSSAPAQAPSPQSSAPANRPPAADFDDDIPF